ncbi:MAG: ABC transporter permease [Acidobacteria bacterium]|nr:ABC transporter permease [Acidobacteriota bacterium]MBI3425257.1 ABC transporter permease [Acidobacteriota bacterium]
MSNAANSSEQNQPTAAWQSLSELTLMRLRELVRTPEALFWTFVFPILMACALGIAFRNTAPTKTRVAVENAAPNAPNLAATLSRAPELDGVLMSPAAAHQALRSGKVALIVRASSETAFEYQFDPTRPESRSTRLLVNDVLQRAAGRADVASVKEATFTEPGARYIDFLVPGLIGMNLLSSGLWGFGFAIVLARTEKLLKQLSATPMRRWQYLLSFMLSRLLFLGPELIVLLGFAYLVFGVRMHGSWLTFGLLAVLGSLTSAGLGLLVAARTKTLEAAGGLMNLVILPMWILSGTFFSATRFPDFAQPFIKALPLTAMNDSLRAVMNEGAPLSATTLEIGILAAWAMVTFAIALRIFRWQ